MHLLVPGAVAALLSDYSVGDGDVRKREREVGGERRREREEKKNTSSNGH